MSKILFRVFFTITAALVIVIFAALLGNYLQKKVVDAEEAMKASGEAAGLQLSRENLEDSPSLPISTYALDACGIDITKYSSTADVISAVNVMSIDHDCVLIPICDNDGKLLYVSSALEKLTRYSYETQSNTAFDNLTAASEAASYSRMDSCAYFIPSFSVSSPTNAAFIDNTLIDELRSIGISKVLIKIPLSDDDGYTKWIQSYVTSLDFSSDELGIAFASKYVLEPEGIKQLQLFSEYGAFTAVYFDSTGKSYDSVYESVSHDLTSMMGMFELYTITVIIEDNENAEAVYNACLDSGVENISFIGNPPTKTEASSTSDSTDKKNLNGETDKVSNPYAGYSPSSTVDDEEAAP